MSEGAETPPQGNTDAGKETPTTPPVGSKTPPAKPPETPPEGDAEGSTLLTGGKKETEGTPTEGDIEPYEPFNTPEGIELDKVLVEEFTKLARASNLTQEQAQAYIGLETALIERRAQAEEDAFKAKQDNWIASLKADPDYGGASFDETVTRGHRWALRFLDSETLKFLNDTGLGNHPGLVKAFARADKLTGEDRMVEGAPPPVAKKEKTLAERIFPDHGKEKK